ncbi:MAG: sigma 54-interacting transcriptional regulator [Pseudomonadota bacterium]
MEDLFQKKDIVTHALESSPGLSGTHLIERRCQLTVLTGARKSEVIEIENLPFHVGKGGDNQLVLPDPTVSREHFVLAQDRGSFLIRDLGSTNGTWIDQMRIREAYLRPGALIKAGSVELRFEPLYKPVEVVPSEQTRYGSLVGRSLAMRQIFALLDRVAHTEATVIILGETGTGKGAVAKALHDHSLRKDGPFVVVDCGAIAENLVESELFGHEKGSYTGATSTRRGALEQASGGTLFIDELVDLRLDLQPKLLRALEEREYRRLGSNQPLKFDARIIAASKRDLWSEVQAGNFREDLYFRLAVFTIPLPPLRDRIEDLPLLVQRFADELKVDDAARARLGRDTLVRLSSHDWPGNIRELRNAVDRVLYFGAEQVDPLLGPITAGSSAGPSGVAPSIVGGESRRASAPVLPQVPSPPPRMPTPPPVAFVPPPAPVEPGLVASYELPFKQAKELLLEQFEGEYLRRLLQRCKGQISLAAREAEIDRKHLYNLMKKYDIDPGDAKS